VGREGLGGKLEAGGTCLMPGGECEGQGGNRGPVIYEGEDGVGIAWAVWGGPGSVVNGAVPGPGRARKSGRPGEGNLHKRAFRPPVPAQALIRTLAAAPLSPRIRRTRAKDRNVVVICTEVTNN